jgi:hypothetical protein
MKVDWMKVLVFSLTALILQYLLCISEWTSYSDMVSDIQGYKYNFYRDVNNNFSLKDTLILTFGYIGFVLFFYFCIIIDKRSYLLAYFFGIIISLLWDVAILTMFAKAENHIPVLAYDAFVVGAGGLTLAAYLFYNFYDILRANLPLLIVAYFASMGWFLYDNYVYSNPPPDFAAMFKR